MENSNATFRVLLLGNHGIEISPIAPDAEELWAHVGQACAPLRCWCGTRHIAGEPADLTIHLGPSPPEDVPMGGVTIAFVPRRDVVRAYPIVSSEYDRDFGPEAAAFVEHLVGTLMRPGLIGLDFADVRDVLLRARYLRFWRGTGFAAAPMATQSFLHIIGAPTLSLHAVSELADHYYAGCTGNMLFAATTDEDHGPILSTSLIYESPLDEHAESLCARRRDHR
jgi:hypothetical protein